MQFVDYMPDLDLEVAVRKKMKALGISDQDAADVMTLLGPLGMKGEAGDYHRRHSLRVGIVCAYVAEFLHLDARALLFAGLLHDVGKALVPACVLGETARWTEEEQRLIEPHVLDGFRLLRDRFDFTAHVILWHHKFQGTRSYPAEFPPSFRPFSPETLEKAKQYGEVLALCDGFDALHRVNSSSQGRELYHEVILAHLKAFYPAMAKTVESLVEAEVWPFARK